MKVFINDRLLFSGNEWVPNDEAEFKLNIISLIKLLNCFNFLRECDVLYNSLGMKSLFENIELISDEYFLSNEVDQLRNMINEIEATDWSTNKKQKANSHNYFLQLEGGIITYNVNETSVAEAAEYRDLGNQVAIVNLYSSEFNIDNLIYVNCSKFIPPYHMQLININVVRNDEELINFYLKNRQAIEFRINTKHGENHNLVKSVNGETISPLECTKSEANTILQFSIGGGEKLKELYSYDEKRDKYIVFKYDNTNNPKTYHGYHPHNQEEIPLIVKEFIEANRNLLK